MSYTKQKNYLKLIGKSKEHVYNPKYLETNILVHKQNIF